MIGKMYKLFRKQIDGFTKVEMPQYLSGEEDYYAFVKKYTEMDFIQVIVNFQLMMELLKYYFYNRNGSVIGFELIEDDEEISKDVNGIFNEMSLNKNRFSILRRQLDVLMEESSMDIKGVSVKAAACDEVPSFITVQSNGIIYIEGSDLKKEEDNVKQIVEQFYENN